VFARQEAHPNLSRLDKDGKIRKLKPPPIHINCTPTPKLLCDPVSGQYVVQGVRDERVYAFHPLRDEWRPIPSLSLPEGESLGSAIATYGSRLVLRATAALLTAVVLNADQGEGGDPRKPRFPGEPLVLGKLTA
jgi:hypothetical protein